MVDKRPSTRTQGRESNASSKALTQYFDDMLLTDLENKDTSKAFESEVETLGPEANAKRLFDKAHQLSILMDSIDTTSTSSTLEVAAVVNEPMPQEPPLKVPTSKHIAEPTDSKHEETKVDYEVQTRDPSIALFSHLDERFQVLLCEVAGVTLAIPLTELGGIHKLSKISPIVGKPSWFLGMLILGEQKLLCIDTAQWIMPERLVNSLTIQKTKMDTKHNHLQNHENDKTNLDTATDYKFAIQLGKTPYVLCCNSISHTIELTKDDVKWRDKSKGKPWLAGLLKEKMCALVDGARMVQDVQTNHKQINK